MKRILNSIFLLCVMFATSYGAVAGHVCCAEASSLQRTDSSQSMSAKDCDCCCSSDAKSFGLVCCSEEPSQLISAEKRIPEPTAKTPDSAPVVKLASLDLGSETVIRSLSIDRSSIRPVGRLYILNRALLI